MDDEAFKIIKSQPLFQTVEFPIEYLLAPDYNPRDHTPEKLEALKKSMTEDPDFLKLRPLIVNTFEGREGIVIGGSKRLLAGQELEMKTIPCIFVYVPPIKEKAWNLKDNIPTGQWIEEKRKEVVMDLRNEGYDIGTLGFGGGEVMDVMGGVSLEGTDPKNDPNYNGTTPKRSPKIKIAEGAELECPACHTKFTYGVKVETTGEDPASVKSDETIL